MILFVCYERCSTCKKAREWLDARGVRYTERDIKGDNPSADELRAWQRASGLALRTFFNTSGVLYRELGLKDRLADMPQDEQLALLASDGMLVKRPILVTDKGVFAGFKPDEWQKLL